jgi:hypothetical protein
MPGRAFACFKARYSRREGSGGPHRLSRVPQRRRAPQTRCRRPGSRYFSGYRGRRHRVTRHHYGAPPLKHRRSRAPLSLFPVLPLSPQFEGLEQILSAGRLGNPRQSRGQRCRLRMEQRITFVPAGIAAGLSDWAPGALNRLGCVQRNSLSTWCAVLLACACVRQCQHSVAILIHVEPKLLDHRLIA